MLNRRVMITRRGGPEVLRVVTGEPPQPGEGQVLVRVEAAGVAFADVMMREGIYPGAPPFPFSPGYDIVGRVEGLGPGVEGVAEGSRVAALTVRGGYADYVCLDAEDLAPVPEGLDPAEAVSLVLNYLTAWQMLHRVARVETGDSVLVQGAAGGVGTALLQLGGLAGLRMFGTASRGKLALVESLGAVGIDYRSEDFTARVRAVLGGDRLDAAFDPLGGRSWRRSFRLLGFGGILIGYGFYGGMRDGRRSPVGALKALVRDPHFSILPLIGGGRRIAGYNVTSLKKRRPGWHREDLGVLFELLQARKIAPVIAERLPLERAARAHELLGARAVSGKIVLLTGA
ncbi:medium chain dehydrogenase/reductase family protein [bacterium]|nr:medium chain dehydrogenase/reductase family protein [bacterium]